MIALLLTVLSATLVIDDVRIEMGDGRVINRGKVIINNGIIENIVTLPNDGKAKKVLTPGLIETQSTLGLNEIAGEKTSRDSMLQSHILAPAFSAADGFNANSVHIPISREEGITSAVVAPQGAILFGTGNWLDLQPKLDAEPAAMFGNVGNDAAEAAGNARGGVWLLLREAFEDARFYRAHQDQFDRGDARALSLSPLQLRALFPVLDKKIPLILEAHRESDIQQVLKFSKQQNIRVVISGGTEAWRVAKELARAQVPVILTRPSAQTLSSFERLGARDDSAALLQQAGVELVISSGGEHHGTLRLRQEVGIAVSNGLPRAAAIATMTRNAAHIFGRNQIGTISIGKRADLVLWSADPLEVTSIAEAVWIQGEPQSLQTRQKLLAQKYLK